MRRSPFTHWPQIALTLAYLSLPAALFADEHPKEHPSEHPKEHPSEHPSSSEAKLSVDQLADAITLFVKEDAALHGGYLLVWDPVAKKPLALTLDKVHREKLAGLGDGVYFLCADFKATDGHMYDLDVFMKQGEHGLATTQISVHKEEGKARYGWVEKDGVWTKQ